MRAQQGQVRPGAAVSSASGSKKQSFRPRYVRMLFWPLSALIVGWLTLADGFVTVTRHGGFALREIQIYNAAETSRAQVLTVSGLRVGESVFAVDLQQAKRAIDGLDWVQQSHIVRVLPGSIHIYLTEHRPAAIWQHQGRRLLIGHDGSIIEHGIDKLPEDTRLPVITGARAPESFHLLKTVLESYPELSRSFTGAKISRAFRWTLYMENGSMIRLPGKNIDEAFVRLRWLDEQFDVLSLKSSVIDLRVSDRAAIGDSLSQLPAVSLNDA